SFFKKSPSESGLDPLTGAVAILTTVVLQHFAGRATLPPAQSGPAVARFLLPPPPPPPTLSLKPLPTTTTMKVDQESLNCTANAIVYRAEKSTGASQAESDVFSDPVADDDDDDFQDEQEVADTLDDNDDDSEYSDEDTGSDDGDDLPGHGSSGNGDDDGDSNNNDNGSEDSGSSDTAGDGKRTDGDDPEDPPPPDSFTDVDDDPEDTPTLENVAIAILDILFMLALMYRRFFEDLISRHQEVELAEVVDYVEEVDVVTSLDIIENTVPAVIPTTHLTPHLIITGVVFFMTLKLRGSLKMDTKIGQISASTNDSRDEEATAEKPSQAAVKSVVKPPVARDPMGGFVSPTPKPKQPREVMVEKASV
ncbi:hypothetical protein C0991_006566, partial [Blastosporella zonata]